MEQQLAGTLQGTLSPDAGIRQQAESALLTLHAERGCGLALVHLILSHSSPITLRQSAAVSLRKWIRERWSALFDAHVGFPPDGQPLAAHEKAPIRQALLQMLSLSGPDTKKLRTSAAACLSLVSSSDWPDDFPELLPAVQSMLQPQGDAHNVDETTRDRVHGGLAFLAEFWTSEMDERQILGGAKEMLPTIEALLANEAAYSPSLRARCVVIFRQLLSSLYMVRDVYKDASKQIAHELLPKWLQALTDLASRHDIAQQLADPSISAEDKHGWMALLNEIWKALDIACNFKAQIKHLIPDLLRIAIAQLRNLQPAFAAFYLESDSQPPFEAPDGDADIQTTLPSLLCSVVDFVVEVTREDRGRDVLVTSAGGSEEFHSLFASCISYARITAEEEQEWSTDADAFVAAMDDDGMEYGLRVACVDLISFKLSQYKATAANVLFASVKHAITASSGSADWKTIEAALTTLGSTAETLEEWSDDPTTNISLDFLQDIFRDAVLPSAQGSSPPLLKGRAYIFASQFGGSLPDELVSQFVEASTQALEAASLGSEEETLIVKLSAVRCVKNFYRGLLPETLAPFTPRIIAQLGPLLSHASGDTLLLIVETMQAAVSDTFKPTSSTAAPHDSIAPETYADIVRAVLKVWSNDVKDFILLSAITDLLETLAGKRDDAVALAVVSTAQSLLIEAFRSAQEAAGRESAGGEDDDSDDDVGQGLLESTLSVTESILNGARGETLQRCQSAHQLCGPICQALQSSQDRDVLQTGMGCLTQLVRKCTDDVASWQEGAATTHFLHIIRRLLVELQSESGGLKMGEFIIALLRKMPQSILQVLPDLLTAMVQRLSSAMTSSFTQSLVLPFAYLLKENQTDTVCDLLLSTPGAMETLARKWTEHADSFIGFWAHRISNIGLTRLLDSQRPFLSEIHVRGDVVVDPSEGPGVIRTRSRAKAEPEQYTSVSLGQKIVKLLVNEFDNATSGPPGSGGVTKSSSLAAGDDADDDGDDDGWDSDSDGGTVRGNGGGGGGGGGGAMLSDLLGDDLAGIDDEDDLFNSDPSDEDLRHDEVWNMDFKGYLRAYLTQMVVTRTQNGAEAQQHVEYLLAGLNDLERRKLQKIVSEGQGVAQTQTCAADTQW